MALFLHLAEMSFGAAAALQRKDPQVLESRLQCQCDILVAFVASVCFRAGNYHRTHSEMM